MDRPLAFSVGEVILILVNAKNLHHQRRVDQGMRRKRMISPDMHPCVSSMQRRKGFKHAGSEVCKEQEDD